MNKLIDLINVQSFFESMDINSLNDINNLNTFERWTILNAYFKDKMKDGKAYVTITYQSLVHLTNLEVNFDGENQLLRDFWSEFADEFQDLLDEYKEDLDYFREYGEYEE